MTKKPSSIQIWWQAFRYHFVPPSFLPAILGAVIAWALAGQFSLLFFIVTVVGVTMNHIALNMTDDYFDFMHSVDRAKEREKNPYSGGSGTLTSGLIQPKQMHSFFMACYISTVILGLYLTAMRGWMVLLFGVIGMGSAYFYTAPPVRYGYHGFGEISQLINFSVTIGLGSYYVQAQHLSWEALWAVLPLGFMMFAMIIINEIPDKADDEIGGKRTLIVIFGEKMAVWLYGISMLTAFLIIIISPILKVTSYWIHLGLIPFPWLFRAFFILYKKFKNPVKMAPANMMTIRIHNITGIFLIIGYLIQGIQNEQNVHQMWIPLIILLILYLPVALTIFFKGKFIKSRNEK